MKQATLNILLSTKSNSKLFPKLEPIKVLMHICVNIENNDLAIAVPNVLQYRIQELCLKMANGRGVGLKSKQVSRITYMATYDGSKHTLFPMCYQWLV